MGKRYAFKYNDGKRDKYLVYPIESENWFNEALNSFLASFSMVKDGEISLLLNDIHTKDYWHMPDSLTEQINISAE